MTDIKDWFFSERDSNFYHWCPTCQTYIKCSNDTRPYSNRLKVKHYLTCGHSILVHEPTGDTITERS